MKKEIKIFLGSSIVEFKELRDSLSSFIDDLNSRFEDRYDFTLKLFRCDDGTQNPYISKDGTQSEIDKNVLNSDICLFIFGEKLGEFTKGEFDLAYKKFSENEHKSPQIAVYFQKNVNVEEDIINFQNVLKSDLKYYYTEFDKDSIIKLSILVGLNNVVGNVYSIKIDNGNVSIDGVPLNLNIDEIPQFKNNKELLKLKNELVLVNDKYQELKPFFVNEEVDNSIQKEFFNVAERRDYLLNRISELENHIFTLSNNLISTSLHGELTPRMAKAFKHLDSGDNEKALSVMDIDDIQQEYKLEENASKQSAKKLAENYIDELSLYIKILKTSDDKGDNFLLISQAYKEIIKTIKKRAVKFNYCSEYLNYLLEQNATDFEIRSTIDEINLLLNFYEDDIGCVDLSYIYSCFGYYNSSIKKYNDAIKYFIQSINLIEKQSEKKPNEILFYINQVLKLAETYRYISDYSSAEEWLQKAIHITNDNNLNFDPISMWNILYDSFTILAKCLQETGYVSEAVETQSYAINVAKKLLNLNENIIALPKAYLFMANLYSMNLDYDKAYEYFLKTKDLFLDLYKSNPNKYSIYLPEVYKDLANYFVMSNNLEEAKKYYLECIDIYEKLVLLNHDRWISELGLAFYNYGFYLEVSQQYDECEKYYLKAEKILIETEELESLAKTYLSLGEFYLEKEEIDLASEYLSKLEQLLQSLNKDNNEYLEAKTKMLEGSICKEFKDYNKAIESYKIALDKFTIFLISDLDMYFEDFNECIDDMFKTYELIEDYGELQNFAKKILDLYLTINEDNQNRFIKYLANVYLNLGICFKHFKSYNDAIKAYLKGVDILEKTEIDDYAKIVLARLYILLGVVYGDIGNIEQSSYYYKKIATLI